MRSDLQDELSDAIRRGNLRHVKALLKAGADVNDLPHSGVARYIRGLIAEQSARPVEALLGRKKLNLSVVESHHRKVCEGMGMAAGYKKRLSFSVQIVVAIWRNVPGASQNPHPATRFRCKLGSYPKARWWESRHISHSVLERGGTQEGTSAAGSEVCLRGGGLNLLPFDGMAVAYGRLY